MPTLKVDDADAHSDQSRSDHVTQSASVTSSRANHATDHVTSGGYASAQLRQMSTISGLCPAATPAGQGGVEAPAGQGGVEAPSGGDLPKYGVPAKDERRLEKVRRCNELGLYK